MACHTIHQNNRKFTPIKKKQQNTIDINITQMMVGKQWIKNWYTCWTGETSTQVKEVSQL